MGKKKRPGKGNGAASYTHNVPWEYCTLSYMEQCYDDYLAKRPVPKLGNKVIKHFFLTGKPPEMPRCRMVLSNDAVVELRVHPNADNPEWAKEMQDAYRGEHGDTKGEHRITPG